MVQKNKTVLIRGGTLASGERVDTGYARYLEKILAKQNVTVINRSQAGDNSFDAVSTFDEDISPFHPDIIIIHYGIDDAYFPVYRSEFKENLVQLVRKIRSEGNPEIILLTSHIFPNQYDMDAVNIYYRTIREVALDLKCTMIPVHTIIAGCLMDNEMDIHDILLDDDRYLNEKGHALFTDIVLKHLQKSLQE